MSEHSKEKRKRLEHLRKNLRAGEKVCSSCETVKSKCEFSKDKSSKDGLSAYCNVCNRARSSAHGKSLAGRNCRLKRSYGIDLEEYQKMLDSQGGVCKICKSPEAKGRWRQFHVDHCHKNGHVRGILCNRCNTMLGMIDDDPSALRAALKYLKEN